MGYVTGEETKSTTVSQKTERHSNYFAYYQHVHNMTAYIFQWCKTGNHVWNHNYFWDIIILSTKKVLNKKGKLKHKTMKRFVSRQNVPLFHFSRSASKLLLLGGKTQQAETHKISLIFIHPQKMYICSEVFALVGSSDILQNCISSTSRF